jgi:hypothetical protein
MRSALLSPVTEAPPGASLVHVRRVLDEAAMSLRATGHGALAARVFLFDPESQVGQAFALRGSLLRDAPLRMATVYAIEVLEALTEVRTMLESLELLFGLAAAEREESRIIRKGTLAVDADDEAAEAIYALAFVRAAGGAR